MRTMTRKMMFIFLLLTVLGLAVPTSVSARTPRRTVVTFKDGITGRTLKKMAVKPGKKVKAPKAPRHKGYAFQKWTRRKVRKNIVLTARYNRACLVSLYMKRGKKKTLLAKKAVPYGGDVKATLPKTGTYRFSHWEGKMKNVKKDHKVIAVYKKKDLTPDDVDYYHIEKEVNSFDQIAKKFGGMRNENRKMGSVKVKRKPANYRAGYQTLTTDSQRKAYNALRAYLRKEDRKLGGISSDVGILTHPYRLTGDLADYYKSNGFSIDDFWVRYNSGYGDAYRVFINAVTYDLYTNASEHRRVSGGQWWTSDPVSTVQDYHNDRCVRKAIRKVALSILDDVEGRRLKKKVAPYGIMTERKASAMFVYSILDRMDYSAKNYSDSVTVTNALNARSGCCVGYARLYKELCDSVGIKCQVVVGSVDGDGHAWNRVRLDGKWYYMDLTFADKNSARKEYGNNYMYSGKLWPTHIVDYGLTTN